MIYMERVMTKLTGSRSRHRRTREQSSQTTAFNNKKKVLDDSESALSLDPGEINDIVNKQMKKLITQRVAQRKNKKSVFIQKNKDKSEASTTTDQITHVRMFSENLKMNSKSTRPVSFQLDHRIGIDSFEDHMRLSLYDQHIEKPFLRNEIIDHALIKEQSLREDLDESLASSVHNNQSTLGI